MAIQFLNHLDIDDNELRNAKLHISSSNPTSEAGQIYYNSSSNVVRYYNGSEWVSLDSSGNAFTTIAVSGQSNVVADSATDTLTFAAGSNVTITTTAGTDTVTIASTDTQLSEEQVEDFVGGMVTGNTETGITVTYQDGDGTLDFVVSDLTVAGDSGSTGMTPGDTLTIAGGTNVTTAMSSDTLTITATDTQLSTEQVQDIVGAMFSSNTETRITATYQDGDGTIDLVVDDMTANDNDDVSVANLKTRLAGGFASNAVQIGDSNDVVTIGNDLVVTGDLTVSGDTISANVGTLNVEDKNITLNQSSGDSSSTADGAGITIQDAVDASNDATLLWNATSDKFVFSHLIEAPGTSIFTNLDISGNVDVDGTLEADAITINGSATGALALLNTVAAGQIDSNAVTTAKINADAVTGAKIADNAIDSEHYTDGSIDTAHIGDDQVTYAKIQNVSATNRILGRDSSGAGVIEEITPANVRTMINVADGATADSAASAAEVQTGTNTAKFVTPDTLASRFVHATIDVSDSNFTSNLYAEITHSLGTEDVIVQLFDSSTKETVFADVARTDKSDTASTSKVKISFGAAPSNDIEVIITSAKGSTAGSVAYA
tara:strand:- start:1422 stop:3233 length:1812 start_codon:yes stop_codon:yes gene_type:complete